MTFAESVDMQYTSIAQGGDDGASFVSAGPEAPERRVEDMKPVFIKPAARGAPQVR
jgi:hypothetical protein